MEKKNGKGERDESVILGTFQFKDVNAVAFERFGAWNSLEGKRKQVALESPQVPGL